MRLVPDTRIGSTFGHEFTGIVEEVGSGVQGVKKGDWVMLPFQIFCGGCYFCTRGLTSCCDNTNPATDEHIRAGRIQPQKVFTHRLPLEQAPLGYHTFAQKLDGCIKVALFPTGPFTRTETLMNPTPEVTTPERVQERATEVMTKP